MQTHNYIFAFSVVLCIINVCCTGPRKTKYLPTWASLDKRPLPKWFDEAKFGIFIHWGVFSVPSYGNEWFWSNWKSSNRSATAKFMAENYRTDFTYQDFAPEFTAEFFDPNQWAEIFQSSGAKYIVLTSKHHEGYTLWPSKYSFSWNSMDVGPHKDLVGDLCNAIRTKTNIKFGIYHSLFEWFNPLYQSDKRSGFKTDTFVTHKTIPELVELVMNYKPEIIWSDGEFEATDSYWKSRNFISWLYNDSPVKDTVVVNDRWGKGVKCKHGDFYTCHDRYNPGVLQVHKWENCMTIDKFSWGYRRNAQLRDYLTTSELLTVLAETVSCGGNLLLNVGPTKDGMIPVIFEERLREIGKWLSINGDAIYATKPWTYQNDTETAGIWYTMKENPKTVYVIISNWPQTGLITLGKPKLSPSSEVTMLGYQDQLEWQMDSTGILIHFPNRGKVLTDWAWVLQLTKVLN